MKPRLDAITLAVDDLEKSLAFDRDGLGLPTRGIVGTEFKGSETASAGAAAFFELQGGLMFALYPRTELAKDAGVPNGAPSSLEFSLGYVVGSRNAVDDLLQQARAAGGRVVHDLRGDGHGGRAGADAVHEEVATPLWGRW
jgi:uncharacterized protein